MRVLCPACSTLKFRDTLEQALGVGEPLSTVLAKHDTWLPLVLR
jgi:hypothetical protein